MAADIPANAGSRKPATPQTCAHNRAVLDALPFGDSQDFEDARRGFIATLPKVEFRNAEGRVIYSLEGLRLPRLTSRRPTRSTPACGARPGST